MARKVIGWVSGFLEFADRVALESGAVAVAAMACVVVASVVWRYFLHSPLIWSDEVVRLLLVFVTFIGPIPQMVRGGFGEVEIVVGGLRPAARRVVRNIASLMGVAFTGLAAALSAYLVLVSPAAKGQVTPVLSIPMTAVYGVMPVGLSIMFLRETVNLLNLVLPDKRRDTTSCR